MLLSILIPTKNRSNTVLYAINSALNIRSQNFEIIVQDCSDDDNLKILIQDKFKDEIKIKYFYSNDSPSLTENWNRAISNSNGEFLCGIGDDDAVLKDIYDVTMWMKENNVETLLGSFILYIWPDAYENSYLNSKISYEKNYSGDLNIVDLNYYYKQKALNCGFGYTENMPNLYHGIVQKTLFNQHKKITGKYLDSTSFDVYNAFIISSYTKNFIVLDYPITIRGISGKSNANRIIHNKSNEHFNEFNNIIIPNIFPNVLNSEISIAESTYIALFDTSKFDIIENFNLSILYGKISANNLLKFPKYYLKYFHLKKPIFIFLKYFIFFLKMRILSYFKNIFYKFMFNNYPFIINKFSKKIQIKYINIELAINGLDLFLSKNNMKINYKKLVKQISIKKEIWDL